MQQPYSHTLHKNLAKHNARRKTLCQIDSPTLAPCKPALTSVACSIIHSIPTWLPNETSSLTITRPQLPNPATKPQDMARPPGHWAEYTYTYTPCLKPWFTSHWFESMSPLPAHTANTAHSRQQANMGAYMASKALVLQGEKASQSATNPHSRLLHTSVAAGAGWNYPSTAFLPPLYVILGTHGQEASRSAT